MHNEIKDQEQEYYCSQVSFATIDLSHHVNEFTRTTTIE